MKCRHCKENSVYENLCRSHFINYFEEKVYSTIKKYDLIKKNQKICVACSGGKDSTTLLYLLKKKYNVEALAVDEGIAGYRDKNLIFLKDFCKQNKIKLKTVSYKKEFEKTLDSMLKNAEQNSCAVCGPLRRKLLNSYAQGYDLVATGHNLDDEVQAFMMNMMRCTLELASRQGIKTQNKQKRFVTKIKPLYFCPEKEVKIYALLQGFDQEFNECPYAHESFRGAIRDYINALELEKKGTKLKLINNFLLALPELHKKYDNGMMIKSCINCKEPSKGDLCRPCMIKAEL